MTRFAPSLLLVVSFSAATLGAGSAAAATLQTNVQYGGSGAVMNVFVPDAADEFPAIVVSLHYCNGAATNAASWLTPSLAEQHGFITIAPGLPSGDGDGCWDVGSSQSLTHDGGSHSRAIAQMVSFAISEYGADASRVYVLGASSGAMMTNVLLGSYPDVFAAGAVFAGVPFGCWTAGDGWTSECANGNTVKTAQQWGDQVRNAYPGYTGPRPRVQLFHGTADTTLHYKNLAEEIKQWTNVLALPDAPTTTEMNAPKSGWTRTSYENDSGTVMLEVAVGQGVGHDLTGQNLWAEIVRFFALDRDVPPGGTGGTGGQAGSSGAAGSAGVAGAGSGGVAGSGGTSGDGAGGAGTAGDAAGGTSGSGGAGSGAGGGVSAGTGGGGTGGSSGTTGSGGTSGAAGGTSGTGGSGATGGSSIPGGSGGTAGTSSAGNSGVAGTTSADDEPADDGGCSVGGPSGAPGGVLVTLLVFLGAVLRRKRRR